MSPNDSNDQSTLQSLISSSQGAMDRIYPAQKRANLQSKINDYALHNPKLSVSLIVPLSAHSFKQANQSSCIGSHLHQHPLHGSTNPALYTLFPHNLPLLLLCCSHHHIHRGFAFYSFDGRSRSAGPCADCFCDDGRRGDYVYLGFASLLGV